MRLSSTSSAVLFVVLPIVMLSNSSCEYSPTKIPSFFKHYVEDRLGAIPPFHALRKNGGTDVIPAFTFDDKV